MVLVANGLEHTRLGLSVGRACWKSAVRRNRVRRVFREAFRLSREELPRGVDLVLIPAAPKLQPELEETRRELVAMAAKARRRYREREREGPGTAVDPGTGTAAGAGRSGSGQR